jgi:hypothetical protein
MPAAGKTVATETPGWEASPAVAAGLFETSLRETGGYQPAMMLFARRPD